MALQRIDTAFGPNPIRFNGNLQPQANANVWLGNVSSYFNGIYSNQFIGTATHANLSYNVSGGTVRATAGSFSSNLVAEATTVTGNVNTGSFVTRGGAGIAGIAIVGGNLVAAATTTSTSITTGALVVEGGAGFAGNIFTSGWVIPSANTTQNLGTTTNWWGTLYGVSTQARYADLAENYQADAVYTPGTVLVFGGTHEVTTTDLSHDTRVAGVVSTEPAYLMNAMQGNVALALTGRVPCRVKGPVAKGTVLVTSDVPGVAEAINNSMYRPGCVLGKSLGQIDNTSIQTIEVVVGRF